MFILDSFGAAAEGIAAMNAVSQMSTATRGGTVNNAKLRAQYEGIVNMLEKGVRAIQDAVTQSTKEGAEGQQGVDSTFLRTILFALMSLLGFAKTALKHYEEAQEDDKKLVAGLEKQSRPAS